MTVNEITRLPSGEIIATGISEEEFLEKYAEHYCEWVNGTVIRMVPATLRHNMLIGYLYMLLNAYSSSRRIRIVALSPYIQRLSEVRDCCEPDLMIILNSNSSRITNTALSGPADICIEVVSPESGARDRGDKFEEYEKGGVGEYWIFDNLRTEALFYRRSEEGIFLRQGEDADGNYRTPLLPGLTLNVSTLWLEELPDFNSIGRAVEAMLKKE